MKFIIGSAHIPKILKHTDLLKGSDKRHIHTVVRVHGRHLGLSDPKIIERMHPCFETPAKHCKDQTKAQLGRVPAMTDAVPVRTIANFIVCRV